jgi:pyrroline-5-carboxylate reductase
MSKLKEKIGFIGAGKMATALAQGLIEAGVCSSNQIMASDVEEPQRKRFENDTKATTCFSNDELIKFCDITILAVKPNHVSEVLAGIKKSLGERLLISIAAGVPLASMEDVLDTKARVIRVMPNTPALVRCGASAYSTGKNVTTKDLEPTEIILGAVGLSFRVPEKMLDAVTGLSGSGPAYIFMVIEALSDGGVEMGLPRDIALKLAAQTVLGAAKLVLETGKHPGELKDMVTSPGGTTIEGLRALEEGKVRASFMNAVRAATEKSRKLGGK